MTSRNHVGRLARSWRLSGYARPQPRANPISGSEIFPSSTCNWWTVTLRDHRVVFVDGARLVSGAKARGGEKAIWPSEPQFRFVGPSADTHVEATVLGGLLGDGAI